MNIEYDIITRESWWGRVRRWVSIVCLALALMLPLGGCADMFSPISDEDLKLLSQKQAEFEVKTAAMEPLVRYDAATDDLEAVLDAIEATPALATRDQVIVLQALYQDAKTARLAVFRTARAVPPDPAAAERARADLMAVTIFLESKLAGIASRMGG